LNCSRLPLRYWKKDISVLSEEKEQAQVSRVAAETELERIEMQQTGRQENYQRPAVP